MNQIVQQLKAERNRNQQQLEKLDLAIRAVSSLSGSAMGGITFRPKPHFTAAAKARIAAAQRARWAKWKAAQKK